MVDVLLVDDEPGMLGAWERLFAIQPDMRLAGTLPSADGLMAAVKALRPGLVVIDLTMPGLDPFEAIARLHTDHPDLHIVVFSGMNDDATIRRAVEAGARGFVDKLADPLEMLGALRRVAAGERALPEWFEPSADRGRR